MKFLADTCVISDVYRQRPGPTRWMGAVPPSSVFISVMTVGEIRRGVLVLLRKDARAAARLDRWLEDVRTNLGHRILPVSEDVAAQWGELTAHRSRPLTDMLIAATALVHGLAVVTRNVADFADTGVGIVNPWETA